MSNIRVIASDGEPCESCGDSGDVRVLMIPLDPVFSPEGQTRSWNIALCPQCRIKTEAVLRGSRKGASNRTPNWR